MSDDNKTTDNKDSKDSKDSKESQNNDVQALKERIAALEKEKQEWSSKGGNKDDLSLNDKVKREREDQDKKNHDSRMLESALTFNLTSSDFLKQNESLLPSDISDIFKAADKETYEGAIQKANAIKSAMVQRFFNEQSNVDMLTESQKSVLADYMKLTKNGKEEKARDIYDNLFEPTLNVLKRVKKAEELTRSKMGYRNDKGDSQYKEKLMSLSRKHYLGEK